MGGDILPAVSVPCFDSYRACLDEAEDRERERKDDGMNPEASNEVNAKAPSAQTLRGLDWLNFFLADVQTGIGPFLAIYLAGYGWNEQGVGMALSVGGIISWRSPFSAWPRSSPLHSRYPDQPLEGTTECDSNWTN
jgi:hypothetical protein